MATSSTLSDSSSASSGEVVNTTAPVILNPYCTVNVRSDVPIVLELKTPNFTRWSSYFQAMCGKFGLLRHIDGTAPNPDDAAWALADFAVKSWLLCTASNEVLRLSEAEDQTAGQLYAAMRSLFDANKESRAIFISNQFHTLAQGDLSVNDYCQQMKELADALRDVGHPVPDSQLVLNVLRGVNPKFATTADNLAEQSPFPSFAKARASLAMKELRQSREGQGAESCCR